MAKKPNKYPNRIYSTKGSAERARKRHGGEKTRGVEIARGGGRTLKGYGVDW